MTKEELFKKYEIDESHSKWDNVTDNWISTDIFREMHDGRLPEEDEMSALYVLEFLDKTADKKYLFSLPNAGPMYRTAMRMVYRYADMIVAELEARDAAKNKA